VGGVRNVTDRRKKTEVWRAFTKGRNRDLFKRKKERSRADKEKKGEKRTPRWNNPIPRGKAKVKQGASHFERVFCHG